MKRNSLLFLFAFAASIGTYAQKQSRHTLKHGDYLIMWTDCGMVNMPHATIYCITDTGSGYDITHAQCFQPKGIGDLELQPLPQGEYEQVRNIIDSMPDVLLQSAFGNYGKSSADFAATHILAFINGKAYNWLFKYMGECCPDIRKFIDGLHKCYRNDSYY